MQAVVVSEFGGPEVLGVQEMPLAEPGPDQVRVRAVAIGVNPMDGKIRSGAAFFPVPLPVVLGREVAGVVDAVGAGVDDVQPGDRVVGLADPGHGAYAEYTVVGTYVKIPASVSFDDAVAVPIAAGTALRVLDQLSLKPGEVLLINGASGSVGSMAVQLAVQRGLTVVGTAGPSNLSAVAALGAIPTRYGSGLVERVRALAPQVDAAFDVAGRGALPDLIELRGGAARVITIADDAADEFGVTFSTGSGFGHDVGHIAEAVRGLADGTIRVQVAHTFALEQVDRAHRISDGGHPGGKIVLHPRL